jgi:hypothetical protein
MLKSECPNCGNAVPVFASACAACGIPNGARFGALAVSGSLIALVVAIGFVVAVVVRGQQGPSGPQDYAWLSGAMSDCDAEAQKTPDTLHFLVVPMLSAASDDAHWKSHSLNDIGNATLLRQRDTLEGLADQSLVAGGVQIQEFKVQFKTQQRKSENEWGAPFIHSKGTCYWVNAIIGH